jgi:hypothetical protein
MQRVVAGHATPASWFPFALGFGLSVTGPVPLSLVPTATHRCVLAHATAASALSRLPRLGVGMIVHVVPDVLCASVWRTPCAVTR